MEQRCSEAKAWSGLLKLARRPISSSHSSYILYLLFVLNVFSFLQRLTIAKKFQFIAFVSVDRYKHALVSAAFDPLVARMWPSAN